MNDAIPAAKPFKQQRLALFVLVGIFVFWLGFLTKIYFAQHAVSTESNTTEISMSSRD